MDYAEPVPANLYSLYCDYICHVNQSSRLRQGGVRDIIVASETDFLAVWNTPQVTSRLVAPTIRGRI